MHTNDMAWVSKNCVQVTIPDNATLSDESLRDHLERVAGPISSNGLKRMQRTCDGDRVNIIVRFDREQGILLRERVRACERACVYCFCK